MAPSPSIDLWRPWYVRNGLADYTVEFLESRGIKGVILDLDCTFCEGNKGFVVPAANSAWLNAVKTAGIPVVILSNTGGWKWGEARIKPLRLKMQMKRMRVTEFGRTYGIPTIAGHKPDPASFHEAAAKIGLADKLGAIIVIGDQLRTDIYGGNNTGMQTGLVRRLGTKEFIGTTVSRFFVDRPQLRRMGICFPVPDTNPYDKLPDNPTLALFS